MREGDGWGNTHACLPLSSLLLSISTQEMVDFLVDVWVEDGLY
jgi:hypothetical protein